MEKVESDNTIVGPTAVKSTKARMTYDLAKTYAMAGKADDAINGLKEAIGLEADIKHSLQSDNAKYDFFKSLTNNKGFQELLLD